MENTIYIVDDVTVLHSTVRYAEMCLPSCCLETDCITPLFYCCLAKTIQKNMCDVSDCGFIGPLPALGVGRTT
jgi:hypothetical protein